VTSLRTICSCTILDVRKWWQFDKHKYRRLVMAVIIVLTKAAHMASKKAFCKGSYTDIKLQKLLKDESFIMSVFNAIRTLSYCTMLMYELIWTNKNPEQKEKEVIESFIDKK
jgi:hypothetical protein